MWEVRLLRVMGPQPSRGRLYPSVGKSLQWLLGVQLYTFPHLFYLAGGGTPVFVGDADCVSISWKGITSLVKAKFLVCFLPKTGC